MLVFTIMNLPSRSFPQSPTRASSGPLTSAWKPFSPSKIGAGHRERGGNVVAGVGRFLGQIGVVEVQVTNQAAVGKSRPIRGRPMGRAQQGRAALGGESRSDASRDHARLGLPRPQRATDGV